MLIAIMSATFDHHNADLERNAMRQKLILQAEFVRLVSFYKKLFGRCSSTKKRGQERDGVQGA